MQSTPISDLFSVIVTCLLVLAVLVLCLLFFIKPITRALWRWRNPPEKLAAEKRAYEERLLHPDWAFYERHLQRPVPAELRSLYGNHALLLAEDLEYDEFHWPCFCALDEQTRTECRSWHRLDVVPFANSNGDVIYLKPGAAEADAVYITYHDGGDTEVLAPSIGAFSERLQHASGKFS